MTDHVTVATLTTSSPPPHRQARSISCVIPAYNEAQNLPVLLPRLAALLDTLAPQWEVIVVDDGSRDHTQEVLRPWATAKGFVLVNLSRNFGKEAALSAGLDRARGEVVFLLDADLQHPLELLPRMLERWQAGRDMVYAVREHRDDESLLKRQGSKLLYLLLNAGNRVIIPEDAGDFRLLDRKVVTALRQLPERNRFMKGLYAWVGFASEAIPYSPNEREAGESTFALRSLTSLAVTGITSFSTLPLRVWSGVGFLLALFAMSYGLWVIVSHFFEGNPVPGWATIVAGLMFFSGMQLISVGIIGEYLGRVYEEVKQRPRYVVAYCADNSPLAPPAGVPEGAATSESAGS